MTAVITNYGAQCPCGGHGLLKVRSHPTNQHSFTAEFWCDACRANWGLTGSAKSADEIARLVLEDMKARAPIASPTGRKRQEAAHSPRLEAYRASSRAGTDWPQIRVPEPEPENLSLPLSDELRAEVDKFYRESLAHA